MSIETMSPLSRWVYALKISSWPKLLVPFLLGQGLGASAVGELSGWGLLTGLGFTVGLLVFIVLLNDWADQEVDRIKRDMFPDGCSPKTIPDGILAANDLLLAAMAFGALALGFASLGDFLHNRPYLVPAGLLCLLIFVAYSLPPLRLNYRGGGEFLEMLGVGLALPLFNSYAQSGQWLSSAAGQILPAFLLLSLASAVASGLSDEESDRRGGKHTLVLRFGNPAARKLIELLASGAIVLWLIAALIGTVEIPRWLFLFNAALGGWYWREMHRISSAAVTNAFRAQGQYKSALHRAIWLPVTIFAIYLLLRAGWGG